MNRTLEVLLFGVAPSLVVAGFAAAVALSYRCRFHFYPVCSHLDRLLTGRVEVIVACLLLLSSAQAYSAGIPRHLTIARELVERIKPEDNRYALGKEFISVPGDGPNAKYAMAADCSGFLLAIFERAGYRTRKEMAFLKASPKRKRPAAEDFVFSIEQEKGFRHIRKVGDMKPGDLLAHAMLNIQDQKQTGTTGHVFLVDSEPRPVSSRMPLVSGTQQFEISVIDANEEHVGTDDTRLANPWKKVKGLGKGTIRIYVDDNGEVIGWARTFGNTDRFFSYSSRFPSDTKQRKSAIGRPKGAEASRG